MGFSILRCVRKGHTQFVCKRCSLCDLLQAMSSHSPTVSTMGHHRLHHTHFCFPPDFQGFYRDLERPLCSSSDQQSSKGREFPSLLLPKASHPAPWCNRFCKRFMHYQQAHLFTNTNCLQPKKLKIPSSQWQIQLSTQAQSPGRRLSCSATLQHSAGPVSAQAATECGEPGDWLRCCLCLPPLGCQPAERMSCFA